MINCTLLKENNITNVIIKKYLFKWNAETAPGERVAHEIVPGDRVAEYLR